MSTRITFLGAAQEVTGSATLVEFEQGSILVDCGMYQGRRADSTQRNANIAPVAVGASAAIATHAHIDHSGSLPTLVKAGFSGPIYATPATRDLASYLLRDSAWIQAHDADYLNNKNAERPDWTPIVPPYDDEDVMRTLGRFVGVPYRHTFEPLPGVSATLIDAGHILGSAQLVFDYKEGTESRRLVFSGDLGRAGLPILRDPEQPPAPLDYLVMESTYGDRLHSPVEQLHDDLERVVNETVERGGKVIVPAFAVGRTQELILVLHELTRSGRIPKLPVFIDSPLAINATEVFRLHPECFDTKTRALLHERGDVFAFEGIRFTRTRQESMQINEHSGPAIIISASGMAEAGRVLHHLRNNIGDTRNTILVVGFMAQHTLGRRLIERRREVKIWGVQRTVQARVVVLNGFSAHADGDGLFEYARACAPTRRLFLNHGEPKQQEPLKRRLREHGLSVHTPGRNETIELA